MRLQKNSEVPQLTEGLKSAIKKNSDIFIPRGRKSLQCVIPNKVFVWTIKKQALEARNKKYNMIKTNIDQTCLKITNKQA